MPLKSIQEWLGHSDYSITANIYAHLDFTSKIESADAMAWIGQTTLGKAHKNAAPAKKKANTTSTDATAVIDSASLQDLPIFIHNLLVTGIPPQLIQSWLSQVNFTETLNLADSFKAFSQDRLVFE